MPRHCSDINQVPLLLHKAVWGAKIFWSKIWGVTFFLEFGSKFWENKFGEKINELGERNWEQKGEQILSEANFLGRNFYAGENSFGRKNFGEEIRGEILF